MYPRRLPLPELETVRNDAVAAPVWGLAHLLALLLELLLSFLEIFVDNETESCIKITLHTRRTDRTSLEATTSLWRTLTAAPILLPIGLELKYSSDLASLTLSAFPSIRTDLRKMKSEVKITIV